MSMINVHNKFHMPRSSGSLVITIKQRVNTSFMQLSCSTTYKEITWKKSFIFSKALLQYIISRSYTELH